jgi:hypothetical protein
MFLSGSTRSKGKALLEVMSFGFAASFFGKMSARRPNSLQTQLRGKGSANQVQW